MNFKITVVSYLKKNVMRVFAFLNNYCIFFMSLPIFHWLRDYLYHQSQSSMTEACPRSLVAALLLNPRIARFYSTVLIAYIIIYFMLWTFTCADKIIYSSIVNMTFSSFATSDHNFITTTITIYSIAIGNSFKLMLY